MHKQLLNEAILKVSIHADGPILIKAGDKGADPTLPDMEFVRTNDQPYLPGSSLKGVIRSHCERLARTVGGYKLACDPLDNARSCGERLNRQRNGKEELPSAEVHKRSCFICRIFGNTSLASRFYLSDAHPVAEPKTEERNGVAIDRVFGSVAVGPFNYETVTEGTFETSFTLRNFGLAQLGLVALALRDIQQQRVRIGFGKSRGLGTVALEVTDLTIRYPSCILEKGGLQRLGSGQIGDTQSVYGIGAFFPDDRNYEFIKRKDDQVSLPDGAEYRTDDWEEPEITLPKDLLLPFWRECVTCWRNEVQEWTRNENQAS